jgi:multidrug transporter EmrE-like cation transporter
MTGLINAYLSFLGSVPVLGLILMAAVSVSVGDYAAKAWSLNHSQREWYLLLAFAGYFFSGFFYIPTLLRDSLIITSVLWVLLSAVGFLVIGIVIFKETLSLPQTIGVILGIISVLVLTISGH